MFKKIASQEIEDALSQVSRQYLIGNLSRPQQVEALNSEALEIGLTAYTEFAAENPHTHSTATEFQYVLSGWTQYFDMETGEKFDFTAGDFYAISTGTIYAQKSKPGTRILFIKVPSINDKELVEVTPEVEQWMTTRLKTIRRDYNHSPDSPKANSIRPAAAVAVIKNNCVLMICRQDNGKWSLPGGTLEYSESLPESAIREMAEETGLKVSIDDVVGIYTDPQIKIAYSDGEVRREFTVVFLGSVSAPAEVAINEESSDYEWVPVSNLETLDMAESQRKRVEDLVNYLRSGKRAIK